MASAASHIPPPSPPPPPLCMYHVSHALEELSKSAIHDLLLIDNDKCSNERAACSTCGGNGHGPWACPFVADDDTDAPPIASKPVASTSSRPASPDKYYGVYGNCMDTISSACADDTEIKVKHAENLHPLLFCMCCLLGGLSCAALSFFNDTHACVLCAALGPTIGPGIHSVVRTNSLSIVAGSY